MKKKEFQKVTQGIREKIKRYLKKRWNLELCPQWNLYTIKGENFYFSPVFVFLGDEKLVDLLSPVEIGLFLGTWEKKNFRISFEMADLIAKKARKNVIELNKQELKKWFRKENLKGNWKEGVYLLKYRKRFVGSAYATGKEIVNMLPTSFELALIRKKRGKEKKRKIRWEKLEKFIEFYSQSQLPNFDSKKFLKAIHKEKKKFTIRINPLKTNFEEFLKKFREIELEKVPWHENCFFVKRKDRWITKTLSYILGDFYLQEPASLLSVKILDPQPGEKVLDLCAAPGSKTTQINQYLGLKGTIVANDWSLERLKILLSNLRRWGTFNTIVTHYDGTKFPLKNFFDKVLVDAPCSGVGTDLKSIYKWQEISVRKLQKVQKQLVIAGFEALKRGGEIVYSTCTISKEENEEVVTFLLEKYKGKIELMEISLSGINFSSGLIKNTIRIYPYQNGTESFFVAKLKKR